MKKGRNGWRRDIEAEGEGVKMMEGGCWRVEGKDEGRAEEVEEVKDKG